MTNIFPDRVLALVIVIVGGCGKVAPAEPSGPALQPPSAVTQAVAATPTPARAIASEAQVCEAARKVLAPPPLLSKTVVIEATILDGELAARTEGDLLVSAPSAALRIAGVTNLPSGTELSIYLEHPSEGGASESAVVRDGCFVSPPIGALAPAIFTLQVSTLCLDVEPDEVQRHTGPNGEKLRGPLLRKTRVCTTVEWSRKIAVGSSAANALQADIAHADGVASRLRNALRLAEEGANMGPLRFGRSLRNADASRACADRMRVLTPQVEQLRDDCSTRRSEADKPVCMQFMNLFSCVSCGSEADHACAKVQVALAR